MAELRALAGGRADLLAEVTGIFEGTSEGELDEPLARSAARLCRPAGADETLIPQWAEEGRRLAANARMPPFSRSGKYAQRSACRQMADRSRSTGGPWAGGDQVSA